MLVKTETEFLIFSKAQVTEQCFRSPFFPEESSLGFCSSFEYKDIQITFCYGHFIMLQRSFPPSSLSPFFFFNCNCKLDLWSEISQSSIFFNPV